LRNGTVSSWLPVDNPRGGKFHLKYGFESYGVMPRALRVQDADFEALMMVKKLIGFDGHETGSGSAFRSIT
jgi:hypothetical protein